MFAKLMLADKTCSIIHQTGCTYLKKIRGDITIHAVTKCILHTTEISIHSTVCASD